MSHFLELVGGRKATRAEFEVWSWYIQARQQARNAGHCFIMPRARKIAGELGYCKDTVLRALKALDIAGRIQRHANWRMSKRTGKPYRRPNGLTAAARCFSGLIGQAMKAALSSASQNHIEKSVTYKPSDDIFRGVSPTERVEAAAASSEPACLPTNDVDKKAYAAALAAGTWVIMRDGGLISFRNRRNS